MASRTSPARSSPTTASGGLGRLPPSSRSMRRQDRIESSGATSCSPETAYRRTAVWIRRRLSVWVRCSGQCSRCSASAARARVRSPAGMSRASGAPCPDHSDVKLVSLSRSAALRRAAKASAASGNGGASAHSGPTSRINLVIDAAGWTPGEHVGERRVRRSTIPERGGVQWAHLRLRTEQICSTDLHAAGAERQGGGDAAGVGDAAGWRSPGCRPHRPPVARVRSCPTASPRRRCPWRGTWRGDRPPRRLAR